MIERKWVYPHLGCTGSDYVEQRQIYEALNSGSLFRYGVNASKVSMAEERVSKILGCRRGMVKMVANCTLALEGALVALSPRVGSLVIIPRISFISTASCVLNRGMIPRLIDTDENGFMSPLKLEEELELLRRMNVNVHAVIAANLDGQTAELGLIGKICDNYSVPLIEDCAQAFGATHEGQYAGSYGCLSCFSFQENKLLSCGEGGAIVSFNDPDVLRVAYAALDMGASRSDEGMPSWKDDLGYGTNGKMSELPAAFLCGQLEHFDDFLRDIRSHYLALLDIIPAEEIDNRPEGGIPVSVWLRRSSYTDRLEDIGVRLYSWEHMDLLSHPIIVNRYSSYEDKFPWNLCPDIEQSKMPEGKEVARTRLCLPVPLIEERFMSLVKQIRGAEHG